MPQRRRNTTTNPFVAYPQGDMVATETASRQAGEVVRARQKPSFGAIPWIDNDAGAPGGNTRLKLLQGVTPNLNSAMARGDIFAFNSILNGLRSRVSRTTGGPELPMAAPDRLEIRKEARRRMDRTRDTGRAGTMLSLGPMYPGKAIL